MSFTPQELAEALGGAVQRHGKWYALCPAHADNDPSLCIEVGKTGKTVWYCQPCNNSAHVTAAIKAKVPHLFGGAQKQRGLLPERKRTEAGTVTPAKSKATGPATPPPWDREIEAIYNYTDADGKYLFEVVRFKDRKTPRFLNRYPNPENPGKFIWKCPVKKTPLYRLPEVLKAKHVIIVEGEKDADNLLRLGFTATTNAGGAGKFREDHALALAGKSITIVPDNDNPGSVHGTSVARILVRRCNRLTMANVPSPHKDISDYITAGAGAQAIAALIARAQPFNPDNLPAVQSEPPAEFDVPFAEVPDEGPLTPDLKQLLVYKGKSVSPAACVRNVIVPMTTEAPISALVGFDNFTQRPVLLRDAPWHGNVGGQKGDDWSDTDTIMLADWLQNRGIVIGTEHVAAGVMAVSRMNSFDSLTAFLDSLIHDGVPRVHAVASTYFGAPAGIADEFMRLAMIAAIARAYHPGTKADHVVILEGPQGARKSSALNALFNPHGKDGVNWFRDDLPPLDNKDSALQMNGAWCIEISELDAVNSKRSELSKVKAFISRSTDSYRPPYGRSVVDIPRRTVFFGTTNDSEYLQDVTGNRRWWPVRCGKIDLEAIERDRVQLWAEARDRQQDGAAHWLEDAEAETLARAEQETRRSNDPWEPVIEEFLVSRAWGEVTVAEVLTHAINMDAERWTQREQNRVSRILKMLGLTRRQRRIDGKHTWLYGRDST